MPFPREESGGGGGGREEGRPTGSTRPVGFPTLRVHRLNVPEEMLRYRSHQDIARILHRHCPPPGRRVRLRVIVARIPDDASSIRIQDVSITLIPDTCPIPFYLSIHPPRVRESDRGNRAVYHYFRLRNRAERERKREDRFSEFRKEISVNLDTREEDFLDLFPGNIRYVKMEFLLSTISTISYTFDKAMSRKTLSYFEMKFVLMFDQERWSRVDQSFVRESKKIAIVLQ